MTVHILHLIPTWRDVLREIWRVLKPGGAYLNVKTWGSAGVSIRERLRIFWRDWLETEGFNAHNPGLQDQTEFVKELGSLGAQLSEVEVMRYPLRFTLREELDALRPHLFGFMGHPQPGFRCQHEGTADLG
jgi:hypothetical protein